MEHNTTLHPIPGDVFSEPSVTEDGGSGSDVRILATSYTAYQIGSALDKYYLPIMAPIGITGNILSFLIMVQKHNRNMSFSAYISSLAASDTLSLLVGLRHLLILNHLDNRPGQFWFCNIWIMISWTLSLCSTSFIVSMTFERVYSIIMPHKAASFNTVKRAKITISCIAMISVLYNIPHLFLTLQFGTSCVPFGSSNDNIWGQLFYWFTLGINFFIPFVFLLTMNSVIIHTLRVRSDSYITRSEVQGQNQGQGHNQRLKSTERQIYVTLLLVTFTFLLLNGPGYCFIFYTIIYDYKSSAHSFATYHLVNSITKQAYYTNYGINFFLYVISGKKFRQDLVELFRRRNKGKPGGTNTSVATTATTVASA